MLRVHYGAFHPDLEEAFTRRIRELAGERRAAAVVAPSRRMADRLQRVLTVDNGLALLGVHFHTFHSLAAAVTEGAWGGRRLVADPVFHDRVVDSLLAHQPDLARIFGGESRPRALAGALRSSLRDLADAGVSGTAVEEFFGEDLLYQPAERARLSALLHLGRVYEERLARLRVLAPADIIRLAAERAEDDPGLASFHEIIYYGFYDLTGLQLDFFETVCAHFPVRLYFPYRKEHPAFRFAAPFFEQKLLAHGAEAVPRAAERRPALDAALDGLFRPETRPADGEPRLSVLSASGARDEVWAVAKEILRLRQEAGVPYEDIGVAARVLEPYRSQIAEVFQENGIPFDSSASEPLLRHPLAKCCLNLVSLRLRDFPAFVVEDIFSSPYFQAREGLTGPAEDWRRLIRYLGINAGWLQWRGKLERRACAPVQVRPEDVREGGRGYTVAQENVQALWELVSGLADALGEGLPESWSAKTRKALGLMHKHLRLPEGADARETAVWERLAAEISSLAEFDLMQEPCDWKTYLESLTDKLRRAVLDPGPGCRGVRVRDAMDARGEAFRVLFLIGLKEKMFPRTVLEDPLLRDSVRAALRHPAGYWIAQKSAGHEEERLLFYLLAASARERLYCVYPRSDESGRVQVPSLYLRELCRAAGFDFSAGPALGHVPRQPAAKLEELAPGRASPQELCLRLALEGKTASGRVPECMADPALLDETLAAAGAIGAWGHAGPWDGQVGAPEGFLPLLKRKGLSPTALDSFAACPFQFFVSRVLGLGEPEPAADKGEFPASTRGRIYHQILERFYRGADESLWKEGADWEPRLKSCLEAVFSAHDWKDLGVYPLLWQAAKESMAEALRDFLAWDLAESRGSGLRPVSFEVLIEGEFEAPVPEAAAGLKIHGIVDRVDRAAGGRWRVVDYKTRWTRGADLRKLVLRGELHQLPVYAELAGKLPGNERLEDACIYALEDGPETTGRERAYHYPAAQLGADREAVLAMVAASVAAMRAGRFSIRPEDGEFGVCSRCAFPGVCRKSHGPSRVRAHAGPSNS